MSDSVWLLWFEQEREVGKHTKQFLGFYRTEEATKAEVDRLKDQPVFRDYLQGFSAYESKLDKDSLCLGYPKSGIV